ncbi:MAG: sigma-E processing peptidase SpoIIGA [Erysipelotrichaceae bacterium]
MQAYVEIAFINNMLIMITSVIIASYMQLRPLSYRNIFVYAFAVSLASVLLWGNHAWFIMILWELFWVVSIFKGKYKVYLLSIVLRALISFSDYLIFAGSFHAFVYFLPVNHKIILIQWIILIIIIIIIHKKGKFLLVESQYLYFVKLYFPNKTLKLMGYLDSGNRLSYHQIPIIFIDGEYQEYLQKDNIELIVMNTMNATTNIHAVLISLKINGFKKQKVLVSCTKDLKLPIHCKCLLNVHNISMG